MIYKVLAALDGSRIDDNIFNKALELTNKAQASLLLLHVLSIEREKRSDPRIFPTASPSQAEAAMPPDPIRQHWERDEKSGLECLKMLTSKATLLGVKAEFSQPTGCPGRLICDHARTWNADIILMGSRNCRNLCESLLGSVATTCDRPRALLGISAAIANGENT